MWPCGCWTAASSRRCAGTICSMAFTSRGGTRTRADEASFALTSATGKGFGYFVWQPYRPGSAVFSYIAPILGAALLAVFAIIAVLMTGLRRRSIRLRASEQEIRHLALHDPLTGLPNRSLFNDSPRAGACRSQAQRDQACRALSGSRPVQAGQRYARTFGRRRADPGIRRTPEEAHAQRRHGLVASAATSSRSY